jgi:hypothetical protein
MSYLIYVNGLGPNFRGDNLYEFIFSEEEDKNEVWGENWDSKPSNGYPQPPDLKYVRKVGVLKNTEIKLELIQNSDYFNMIDAIDGVVALAWESDDVENRMVFRFGQSETQVSDILYSKDIMLSIDKKEKYEN